MAYDPTSPWKKTAVIKNKVLDVQNPVYLQKSALDETYTIPQNYNLRPDLCSYDLYGTSKYWWVFAKRNPDTIQDPINDFTAGTKIKIPSKNQLDEMK
tara:strand:+ start:1404 stop:1697 length:294 start_codon:yes stop_codon:yes gene_type:complete